MVNNNNIFSNNFPQVNDGSQFGHMNNQLATVHSTPNSDGSAYSDLRDLSQQKLIDLINSYCSSVIDDHRRCEGLLWDYLGVYKRELNLLIIALREGIPQNISTLTSKMEPCIQTPNRNDMQENCPKHLILCQYETRLVNSYSITAEAARWAVESWALALNFVTRLELSEFTREVTYQQSSEAFSIPTGLSERNKSVWLVSESGESHFPSIGEAIQAASPGAKIVIKPGYYCETLVLEKNLEIIGDGGNDEVIIGGEPGITIFSDNLEIRNVTLVGVISINKGQLGLVDCQVVNEIKMIGSSVGLVADKCKINKIDANAAGLHVVDCEIHILDMSQNNNKDIISNPVDLTDTEKQRQLAQNPDSVNLLSLIQCLTEAGLDTNRFPGL